MEQKQTKGLIYNWTSLCGVILTSFGIVAGIVMLALDFMNPNATIYSGIFTYLVVPVIVTTGLLFVISGVFRERRRRRKAGLNLKPMPTIDLNNRRHYVAFVTMVTLAFVLIILTGVGSFSAYKYSESVAFCGTTCHTPMKPERVACANSPHSHVRCVDCHIGPGAEWFVKAKLSGMHQVYAVTVNNFHRPILTPIHNLRPASETCYECHWPAKFFGMLEQTRTYFSADKSNTPYTISYLLNVGGGDTTHGPARGIHYHMAVSKKIEYIASDEKRQTIPWVRVTERDGSTSVYQTKDKKEALAATNITAAATRRMDCMDCHNRPAHQFQSPNRSLDLAMMQGKIDPSIEFIKKNSAKALLGKYTTQEQALAEIDKQLHAAYPQTNPKVEDAIKEVKAIYARNFFPEMKADWRAYPDDIGHWISAGCFRCHDGKHTNEKGVVISRECKTCHVITAQGPGFKSKNYVRDGVDFVHPVEDDDGSWKEDRCCTCHNGAPD